jgi:uncharacterized membrane protein YccF (DUF307 family)
MRTVLNILWLIFNGWWLALLYALAGLLAFVFIVTIPFGIAAFRIANYALWPFGREIVRKPSAGAASAIGNVLWIILFGWWLALGHILTAIAEFCTIILIPFGIANIKMVPISLTPLGHEIRDIP